jgi:hypothetical protein
VPARHGWRSIDMLAAVGEEVIGGMEGSTPPWQALQRVIAGEVALPGSPAYEQLPKPFNARFHDVQPLAIV